MATLSRKSDAIESLSEDALRAELVQIEERRRAFSREHRAFRDDVPTHVGLVRSQAQARYEALVRELAESIATPDVRAPGVVLQPKFEELAFVKVLASAEIEADLLAAAAQVPAALYSPLTRPQFEERMAGYKERAR